MSFIDNLFNKPKAQFEKACSDFTIFSKSDLMKTTKTKAVVDIAANTLTFFGNSKETIDTLSNSFLYDKNKQILIVDLNSLTEQEHTFKDGDKDFPYKTTSAKFEYKSLSF